MITFDSDSINGLLNNALEFLKENGKTLVDKVKPLAKEYAAKAKDIVQPMVEEFQKSIMEVINNPRLLNNRVRVLVTEATSVEYIVNASHKYMVEGADGVAALVSVNVEGYIIYLCYLNGREPKPYDENLYILIKSNSLADDAKKLFKESELVILK